MISKSNRFLIFGLVILFGFSATQLSAQTPTYSLNECIEYALLNNRNILNSKLERDLAEIRVKETLSTGLPQVAANGGVAKNFIIPELPFTNPITGEETTIAFQRAWTGNALVQLDQMIFDGSYFVGLQAARTYRQLAEREQIATEVDVIEAVSKAYYGVLVAQERLQAALNNYSRIDSLLLETTKLYESGFVEKIDINRVKVQHNLIRTQLDNIRQLEILSLQILQFQMGMPIGAPLQLSESLQEIKLDMNPLGQSSFDYQDRIEYLQLQTNLQLAELDLKNNHVKYLPKLDAFVNYGGNMFADSRSDLFNLNRSWIPNSAAGLSLRVPIFDGFYKSSLIQRNRLQIKQLENQFSLLESSIDLELEEKRIQLANALKRLEAEKENMELGMEVFEVSRIKYQQGVGSNLEVIEAESAYKDAQTNYYVALYDALIAKIELNKALGLLRK
jgi:outer membrane protein TolC